MNVSIIVPLFNPDEKTLKEILDSLKNQKFKGKKEIILTEEGIGLADNINKGIS